MGGIYCDYYFSNCLAAVRGFLIGDQPRGLGVPRSIQHLTYEGGARITSVEIGGYTAAGQSRSKNAIRCLLKLEE